MTFSLRTKKVACGSEEVELAYFTCEPLEAAGFLNAFSTRLGGASPMPRQALHLSPKNDSGGHYPENLRRFLVAIGADGWPLETANQTHSDIRLHVDRVPHRDGDALITKQPNVLVGIKTADCLPVLIADPTNGAMAAVHAGWRGTFARIAEKAVADLAGNPENYIAALGPGACGNCYEIGPDVAQCFDEKFLKRISETKALLDVTAANRAQLEAAGVKPSNIHVAPTCTMHQNELFFSHRKEGKLSSAGGRLLSVIGRV
jgi:YfiH family protein